jgi:hypothetical protein
VGGVDEDEAKEVPVPKIISIEPPINIRIERYYDNLCP